MQSLRCKWPIKAPTKRGFSKDSGLHKYEYIRKVPFVSSRRSIPRGPINSRVRFVLDAVLKSDCGLAIQHRAEDLITDFRLADSMMSHDEVQCVTCRYSAVHVVLKGIRPIVATRHTEPIRQKIICPAYGHESARKP